MDALYRTKPHTIEIENRLPENIKVVADGMYIENVIRNLVENALKYSDDGVNVKVTLQTTDGMLQVAVQDDGWGIAPRYQKSCSASSIRCPTVRTESAKDTASAWHSRNTSSTRTKERFP